MLVTTLPSVHQWALYLQVGLLAHARNSIKIQQRTMAICPYSGTNVVPIAAVSFPLFFVFALTLPLLHIGLDQGRDKREPFHI